MEIKKVNYEICKFTKYDLLEVDTDQRKIEDELNSAYKESIQNKTVDSLERYRRAL